jgi:tetratricopeptide (TPR) repeat protein
MLLVSCATLLAVVAGPLPSLADIIYLRNGRKIVAQVTREDDKQVFYESSEGEVALPRSMVERIEKSSAPSTATPPAQNSSRSNPKQLPLPAVPPDDSTFGDNLPVVKDEAVDEAYLQHLEDVLIHNPSPENARRVKQGLQQSALFLTRRGDTEGAIQKYHEALKFIPHDQSLTLALGYLQVTQNHYLEAIDLLLPEADRNPDSVDVHLLLGSSFYGMENLDQAIAEWKKALALQDNPRLREAVAKAEREREVAGSNMELRSEHFLLRYDGRDVEKLSNEVLESLEGSFHDLVLDLDYSPHEVIVVLLYPNQAFKDITRSPTWVGALNDGKIRIPVSGLTTVNSDLARVLKHELTHSFIRQITQGRCPTWFNEGLAQLEEGASTATLGSQLARALTAGQLPAYQALQASFIGLQQEQVGLAYGKSLAALEYLRDTFGMGEIRRLLKMMPANADLNSLLQEELRLDYTTFDQEVANYVEKRYGS